MTTYSVLVPHLPKSVITSNRTSKSDAGARGKWAERAELQAQTALAIQATFQTEIPTCKRISLDMTYVCTRKRPGDGLYRPKDVGNIGGDILKAVCDALVDMEIIPDDDREHLRPINLDIEYVEEIEHEGILVTFQELVAA